MIPDWIDVNVLKKLAMIVPLAALGTLLDAVVRPRDTVAEIAKGAVVSVVVGTLVGGALIQYLRMDGFVAGAAIALSAYLAPHILSFFDYKGKKLKEGKIDISISGDEK